MAGRRKEARNRILNKQQHHAGKRNNAENQRKNRVRTVKTNAHEPLFSGP